MENYDLPALESFRDYYFLTYFTISLHSLILKHSIIIFNSFKDVLENLIIDLETMSEKKIGWTSSETH